MKIVYSVSGAGEPALVFIQGGLANRAFWDGQLRVFGGDHRMIALDLPGHGESGLDRKKWSIPEFDAAIMKHMGHYPMLERPDEFNRRVAEIVAGLMK